MSDLVRFSRVGGVAVITLDHPPVNALGFAVRDALAGHLSAAADDPDVVAIVIAGAGRLFCAGADIREFNTPAALRSPNLPELITLIEGLSKPVVVALHGTAVGGGCELSLGCHYRVAAPGTRIGLPEVTLGIVPGAGGTQRLPRLIGAAAALDAIVSGKPMPAERAHDLGLVDEVVEGDLVAGAVRFAERVAAEPGPPPRTSERDDKLEDARAHPELFEEFRQKIARRARGYEAPFACIECVEAATNLPFAEGIQVERETFLRLIESAQSHALRHAFFAEREAAKVPGVPKDTPVGALDRAAVLGCGTMGGGIAMCLANAGVPVTVIETTRDALDRGMDAIRRNYAATVKKGRLSQQAMDECLSRITPTLDFGAVSEVDIVIEAVFEEMELKKDIFRRLDETCREGAIMATNTSTLDVNEIASATSRPEQVLGLHFFSPAHIMRLLEIVRAERTSPEVLATALRLSKRLGKVGVVVGVCDGFAANRMLHPYLREAGFLLEEGALPEQVDRVLYEFGLPMGPFAMSDLAGLDVGWRIRKRQAASRPKDLRYSAIGDRLCEGGRFGQKTGAGWFRYEPGSRAPLPDPEVEELIVAASAELRIERREISDEEILRRCLYPLINEGARILEEGIAVRPGDLDVIWMQGFGFPRYRGGPMRWADSLGLDHVHEVMRGFHEAHGDWLEPAALLERLAGEGKGFGEWRAGDP